MNTKLNLNKHIIGVINIKFAVFYVKFVDI